MRLPILLPVRVPMRLIDRYLMQQVALAGFVTVMIVTIVVWLTQVLRLLDLVLDRSAPMGMLLSMLVLTIPTFLGLIIPLALTAAVIFVYYRLLLESELVVMRASGMSNWQLAKPTLLLSLGMVLFCYCIVLFVAPHASRELSRIQFVIKNDYAVALLHDGMFNRLNEGITVYVRDREGTNELSGILLHDSSKPDKISTLFAERGVLQQDEQGSRLVLLNGMRQEKDRGTGAISELKFEQYAIDLAELVPEAEQGWRDPKERTLGELVTTGAEPGAPPTAHGRLLAELNQRIAMPLMNFAFPLLALVLLLTAEINRRGMAGRVAASALAVTLWEVGIIMSINLIPKNTDLVWVIYGLALLPVPVLISLLAYRRKAGGTGAAWAS